MGVPDVTVILAVYNAGPYLHRCLRSLAGQTLGTDRLEIVAVDDGSTDGSDAVLDRFGADHPTGVTVVHQRNSGGPAGPNNRALDLATGRYVFFLGADDYLGRDALRRLVAAADETGADIVLGRMVGVNGRYAHQAIFTADDDDVDPYRSPLAYHLSNTKLFRRELIETHKIRYPEDMPVGCDQPFTIEAAVRARRIAVRADYKYYYAVRRRDAANMTYTSGPEARLAYATSIMEFVADLLEPGPRRDGLLVRHFDWELSKIVDDRFVSQPPAARERLRAGVAFLVERFLTDDIRRRLPPGTAVRLAVARDGTAADLVAVIDQDRREGTPLALRDGDRWYAAYPGFRAGLPDRCFDVTDALDEWRARLDVTGVRIGPLGRTVTLDARTPLPDIATPVARAGTAAATTGRRRTGRDGTRFALVFDVGELIRRRSRKVWTDAGPDREVAVRALVPAPGRRIVRLSLRHLAVVVVSRDVSGQARLSATRLTPRTVWRRLRRRRG